MRILARQTCFIVAVLACSMTSAADQEENGEPGGRWELGLFIPYMAFDTDAPIEDSRGMDDEIRSAFGRGVTLAVKMSRAHAIEADVSWVTSDSEDMGGRNHFVIRTRYSTVAYRRAWRIGEALVPFATAGAGAFYARAMETDHPNYGGAAILIGAGLRYYLDRRSSVRFYVQHTRVDVDPDDANNLLLAVGGTWQFGDL